MQSVAAVFDDVEISPSLAELLLKSLDLVEESAGGSGMEGGLGRGLLLRSIVKPAADCRNRASNPACLRRYIFLDVQHRTCRYRLT